jgi:hypothetical protein
MVDVVEIWGSVWDPGPASMVKQAGSILCRAEIDC